MNRIVFKILVLVMEAIYWIDTKLFRLYFFLIKRRSYKLLKIHDWISDKVKKAFYAVARQARKYDNRLRN